MADIELVIKMSQESYNNIKIGCTQRISNSEMIEAIKNGTPLPKGHGDLIDRRELKDDVYTYIDLYGDVHNIIHKASVDDAPTIVKADKENR